MADLANAVVMDTLGDIITKIAWDSFNNKWKLTLNKRALLELGISHGIYYAAVKAWMKTQLTGKLGSLEETTEEFAIDLLGLSLVDYVLPMAMGRSPPSFTKVLMRNAIGEGLQVAYAAVTSGWSTTTTTTQKKN
jgi:hypothetical protein